MPLRRSRKREDFPLHDYPLNQYRLTGRPFNPRAQGWEFRFPRIGDFPSEEHKRWFYPGELFSKAQGSYKSDGTFDMGWPQSSFDPYKIRGFHHVGRLPYGTQGYGLGCGESYSVYALDLARRPRDCEPYKGDPLPSFAEGFGDYGPRMPRVGPWGIV